MKTNNIIFRMKGIQNEKQQYVAVTPSIIFLENQVTTTCLSSLFVRELPKLTLIITDRIYSILYKVISKYNFFFNQIRFP